MKKLSRSQKLIAAGVAGALVVSFLRGPPAWLYRSEKCLATLQPEVAQMARMLVARAAHEGIRLVVVSCRRSLEQQAELYEQGRSEPGNIVTNARPGYSWHNYGRAFDVAVLSAEGKVTWPENSLLWQRIGEMGEEIGLSWGGRFGDRPHFDFHPDLTYAQARARGEGEMAT